MSIEELGYYILKASYSAKDIMALESCGKSKAYELMSLLREKYQGSVKGRTDVVTSQSYWLWNGSTKEEQIRLWRMMSNE